MDRYVDADHWDRLRRHLTIPDGSNTSPFLRCSCKRPPAKAKKSPVGNWLSFFHLGKSQSVCKRRLKRHPSEPNEIKCMALPGQGPASARLKAQFSCSTLCDVTGGKGNSGTLRSTKSEESLASLQALEGSPPAQSNNLM